MDLISSNDGSNTGTATINIAVKTGSKASYIGRTASLTVNVTSGTTVTEKAPQFSSNASIANLSLTRNAAMTAVTLPAASAGNGPTTYNISPALPAGLSFDASTRVLSGTPTEISASATYTYAAWDGDDNTADSDQDTLTFTIVVAAEPDSAPSFGSSTIANLSLTQNTAIPSPGVTLPAATGGNGALTYALSPALPDGLSFTASTRVLSGTPTQAAAEATYTYTVSDSDNNTAASDEAALTFTITVVAASQPPTDPPTDPPPTDPPSREDTAPAFADGARIADLSLTQNTALTAVTLPAASGGNGALAYAITPALPAGLSFTASTRVLSGTPTQTAAEARYTYTVSDGDANTAASDTDTLTFTITVSEDEDPDEPPEPVPTLPLAGLAILALILWRVGARRLRRLN